MSRDQIAVLVLGGFTAVGVLAAIALAWLLVSEFARWAPIQFSRWRR